MRTDFGIVPNPDPPYPWTAAGVVALDPDFGTRILRVTDPSITGKPMQTNSAGQANLWNTTSTMLLSTAVGQRKYLFQFDPVHFQARLLPYTFTGKLTFSRQDDGRLYQLLGTKLCRHDFVFVKGTWTFSSMKVLYDFATLLPAGFVPEWVSEFLVSSDDTSFSAGFSTGPQDTGRYACNFRRTIGGTLLDTQVTLGGLIHEVFQTPNPRYVFVGVHLPTPGVDQHLWDVVTNTVVPVPLSGHQCLGTLTYRTGGPGGGQFAEVPYTNPSQQPRLIIPTLPSPAPENDKHESLNHLDPLDVNPFVVSMVNKGLVAAAWEGEIYLVDPVTGIVSRACHHLSLETDPLFDVANAIPSQSQDGRFIAYCSDLMGTIAGDLFVVEIV